MFTANYNHVNENLAKTSKEMMSFDDYKPGTATNTQHYYADKITEYANELLEKHPTEDSEKLERVQRYIDRYSAKVAETIDKQHAIDCRCPSVMISGGSNFPVRKKEKQIQAMDALYEQTKDLWETDSRNYYYNKIRLTLTDSGAIRSDDENAVDKIKAKIAKLETMPDPYGNKSAEIRRLKERLLQLAPDEMKAGKHITINGQPATFESIVNVFNSFKPQCSRYSPEENRFYLSIPFIISDGTRNYKCFVSCETNENGTEISTYGNADNGYKTIWKPLDDERKFNLMIGQMSGSGNKSVIYSILKDLAPAKEAKPEALETDSDTAETVTINGETAKIIRNKEEMRLQLVFDGKPSEKTREILKSNGFRWAPSQSAWQRLLNDNSEYALKRIAA